MVIVVGKNSWVGKIFAKLNQEIDQTPLQEKLEKIAKDIGKVGMIAAGITLFVLFARFFIETGIKGFDWSGQTGTYLEQWFRYILISITIVVVAVPEGLPLAVMIALAYSVRKMLKDMNFVKRLASWETMGGANNICSDKTGTLTKNMMTVKELWQGEVRSIHPEEKQYVLSQLVPNEKTAKLFLEACACNTTGTSEAADATEKAILRMLDKLGCNYQNLRDIHCQDPLVRFQFTSKRKKMSTVLTYIDNNTYAYDKRLHVKGAAEMILANWSHYINAGGEIIELGEEMKEYLIKKCNWRIC